MIYSSLHVRRKRRATISTLPSIVREFLREFSGYLAAPNSCFAIRIISAVSPLIRHRNQNTSSAATAFLSLFLQKIRRNIDSITAGAQALPNEISSLAYPNNLDSREHYELLASQISKVSATATLDPVGVQGGEGKSFFVSTIAFAKPKSLLVLCSSWDSFLNREFSESSSSEINVATTTSTTPRIPVSQCRHSSCDGFPTGTETSPQNTVILRAANWFNGCEIAERFARDVRASMLRKVYNLRIHAVRALFTNGLARLSAVLAASLRAALILSQASV